jgi:hypothetical protein
MADSALDYNATVTSISLDNNLIQVLYQPADSSHSGSDVYRNLRLETGDFNDSGVQVKIKEGGISAANIWQTQAENAAEVPSFDPADFVGDVYNQRYKPYAQDSAPVDFNPQLFQVVAYDSEGPDDIRLKYNIVAFDSNEKVSYRSSYQIDRETLFMSLALTNRFDSVQQSIEAGSADSEEAQYLSKDDLYLSDVLIEQVQSVLSLNDSDMISLVRTGEL